MATYKSGDFKLSFTPEMIQYLKEHQRDFMPEDTKAGMIQAYLDRYTGLSLIHISAALEIFDRFQIFFQFIGNSGLGRTLTVLFVGFPNITDNPVEVIQNLSLIHIWKTHASMDK